MTGAVAAPVTLLCGPAGSGKIWLARRLESAGVQVLSYDREAAARVRAAGSRPGS